MGIALLALGRSDESIAWAERALAANPNNDAASRANLYLRIAVAHAGLGRFKEARRAVAEANRAWPYDTVRTHVPSAPFNRKFVALMERYQDGLRYAGHRDHAG